MLYDNDELLYHDYNNKTYKSSSRDSMVLQKVLSKITFWYKTMSDMLYVYAYSLDNQKYNK